MYALNSKQTTNGFKYISLYFQILAIDAPFLLSLIEASASSRIALRMIFPVGF